MYRSSGIVIKETSSSTPFVENSTSNKYLGRFYWDKLKDYTEDIVTSTVPPNYDLMVGNDSYGSSTVRYSPKDIGIPPDMVIISPSSRNFIIAIYSILFFVGAVGNLSVFISVAQELWRKCHRSRIKVLILHLALADLFVILFVIPIEVFWRITIFWNGGDLLCKICQFFRAFGLYLSSNVIICISLDRFYVIISPLKVIGGMRRVKNMLAVAWFAAILCATPQSIVFSVQKYPLHVMYEQCVTYGYFTTVEEEILYNVMSVSAMYFAPLIVILFTYVGVLIKVSRRTREHQNMGEFQRRILQQRYSRSSGVASTTTTPDGLMITSRILLKRTFARGNKNAPETTTVTNAGTGNVTYPCGQHRRGSQFLRMSDTANNINRSRRQAFLLTMIIVTAFVICWTPYVVMTLWYISDWERAEFVDAPLQEAFFIMAVSNSCLNPVIYGNYMRRFCYTCFSRKQRNHGISEDQRSGNRRESCDIGQF